MTSPSLDEARPLQAPAKSARRFWRLKAFCRNWTAVIAATFLIIVLLATLFAPLISVHGPYDADNLSRYVPIGTEGYLLGTDQQGRDMVARLLYGGRISLLVGIIPTLTASAIGLALGLMAGYTRGLTDHAIMRCLDVVFAFPMVLLAIAIAGAMQPGASTEIISITVILIPYFARLARTATQEVAAMPYIEAARAAGGSPASIMLRYLLPNVFSPVIVYATTLMGLMIVVGSGLSFLGLGVQPPTADWGAMVAEGRVVLRRAPHVTVLPGLLILLVSLAFNFLGDGIRDALDPRSIRR
ncbi:ABC transporter permease [Nordella sp. HKS 07]|uniref:ABC transporter permease n=1 Tax=Nordella sp. HKS 07 TaxID=2712222 RepID=UPI0013E15AD6|nr:ABC transporter permease [Nordella sp. HKS 07]QIG49815.1 ABC transporter permease [Nordella sp. HKS 07]